VITHVLLALIVVLVTSRALSVLFARLGQPAVVGEIVAGIAIGPSVLGRIAPGAARVLIPADAVMPLHVLAQVGVVLFMFLVGLELDTSLLRKRTRESIAISNVSVVLPFALGLLLATWLHPRFAPPRVPLATFALFIAVSMSVTAFPVLARILSDRKMQRSPLGALALACAAVDDVTAWCLLALVVSIARSAGASSALVTVGLVVLFATAMLGVVRPLVTKTLARMEPSATALALVLVGVLGSALVTEAIGVHALFGAFLFGAILPHDSPLARAITDRLTDFVVVLLLPAFFAFTGLRTRMDLLHGSAAWAATALVTFVATAGKLGGTFVAARAVKLKASEALSLGVLMNTRGLMELVVLNVGLDLGVV
jgi:Kef-type K+ transport system membrane component KefB